MILLWLTYNVGKSCIFPPRICSAVGSLLGNMQRKQSTSQVYRTRREIYYSESLKDIHEFCCLSGESELCLQGYMCEKNQCCLLWDGWKVWPKTRHTFSTSFCGTVCPVARSNLNELHFVACWYIIVIMSHTFKKQIKEQKIELFCT